jgi:transmembrane 9 superfamily protein 2/4
VNKLSSVKNLPFEYYTLPYCKPDEIINSAENLGEVLRGDRIENTPFVGSFRQDEYCKVACRIDRLTKPQANKFSFKISDEYRVNMILDNLPVGMVRIREDNGKQVKSYERGFPVGFQDEANMLYLNNHLRFTILYHRDAETDLARIVGFEVEPYSIAHKYGGSWNDDGHMKLKTCSGDGDLDYKQPARVDGGREMIFTYDIVYKPSDIRWATRWDTYLVATDDQIHWFSIVNSLMIVLFLSGMVAMIMLRTLHRDISKYNQLETAEDAAEESGWKLVHGDVFRPPRGQSWLAVFVGTGVQLLGMTVVIMIFAILGFLSPANRGGLMSSMLLLFVFMAALAGYYSARLYKRFRGAAWKRNTLRTAFFFPGVVSCIFLFLNFMAWGQRSSGAVPFVKILYMIFLWFGVSIPLCFVGSYFGYRRPAPEEPIRTNKIPRQVPEQPWYMHPAFSVLIGGILPFGAVFIELFFILTSMWLHQFYYLFGFLGLVFLILVVTCAEITIVLCYFQLCSEDYHWWWRAFMTSGSSALYLFMYSAFYFATKLDITKLVPALMYFGYMTIASLAFFFMTGTIGFLACDRFVRSIYASVKID